MSRINAISDLVEAIKLMSDYQVEVIREHVSGELADLIHDVRAEPAEPETLKSVAPGHSLTGCYGHGHD